MFLRQPVGSRWLRSLFNDRHTETGEAAGSPKIEKEIIVLVIATISLVLLSLSPLSSCLPHQDASDNVSVLHICACVAPSIIFYYHPCHHISLVDCHSCTCAARSEKTKMSCVKKYLLTYCASDDISLYTNIHMFQNHPKLNPKQIYGKSHMCWGLGYERSN